MTRMKRGCEIMNQERTDQIKSITARLEMAAELDDTSLVTTKDWEQMIADINEYLDGYIFGEY